MAALETPEFMRRMIDEFGAPEAYNHYAVGWAHAMDTPYQWTKQVASHWGGTRNGTIVHWPNGIEAKGEIRSQFTHVIDVAPTILEAAGMPRADDGQRRPAVTDGGHRMPYTFNDPDAPERHDLQYFEMFGNRGIYHKGWSAVTKHRIPWVLAGAVLPRSTTTCGSSTTAPRTGPRPTTSPSEMPEKLAELQRLWLIEATKYNVLPIDDRGAERLEPRPRRAARARPRQFADCCSAGWAGCRRTAC